MNLQDVKTKTINWCSKMKDEGLITADQYDTCIASFMSSTSGIIPKNFKVPSSGMPINYALYNSRSESLTDNITGENTNTIMLVTNTGLTMACDPNNKIYYVKDINDSKVIQHEIYFTLNPQSNNVYGILSPYSRYLITNSSKTADFSGTAIGPMSSWKIIKTNNTVAFESVQHSGSHLSFVDKNTALQVIRGTDQTAQWLMIPKKQTNINDQYPQYTGAEYIVVKESILTRIRNTAIDKAILKIMKNTLNTLQNTIRDNYTKLDKYMRDTLNYDSELYRLTNITYDTQMESLNSSSALSAKAIQSIKSSLPKPEGITLSRTEINGILYTISNTKNSALKLIDEDISKINLQLSNLPLGDPMDDYVTFMKDMTNEIATITLSIQENNGIMGRQKDNYDVLNKDAYYFYNKNDNYKKLDNTLKLNLNIIDGYKKQNTYITYIYPLVFIICIFLLIYLIYITYKKFMENVYIQY